MYIQSSALYHHGIKGQKWGVRRFQNKNGSLTLAGRKRYDDDGESRKKSYNIPKTKSMHRINLEDKYQKQGMTKEQAEQAAAKRIRTEQIVAATAAVTVAAAIAYKKHVDNGRDFVISKDRKLNRVIRLDEGADPFKGNREYVSYKKLDNMKYKGMMGKFEGDTAKAMNEGIDRIKARGGINNQKYQQMYNMTITPKQDIKVASVDRAKNTFMNLYKNDPDFKKSYDDYMINFAKNQKQAAHGSFKKFAKAAEKGEVSDSFLKSVGYKSFNVSIAERDETAQKLQNKFYNALKEQGMNAIVDLNDKKGMMKTSAPLITFDGDYDYSKAVLSDSEIKKNLAKSVPIILAQNLAKPAAIAFTGMYANNQISKSKKANTAIESYKKEHPNTELTDKEILDMLAKDDKK